MSSKIITEDEYRFSLEYDDVDVKKWAHYRNFDLDDDILTLDLAIKDEYGDSNSRYIVQNLTHIANSIESFLRADGVVIVFMGDESIVRATIRGEDYNISNHALLWQLGITLSWGVQSHKCVSKVDEDVVEEYISLANEAEYYIDYDGAEFDDVEVLMTRGEHGSVCGAAFQSFDGSGNGTLVVLPRPTDLATRPENWFSTTLSLAYPYFPKYLKDSIESDDSNEDENIPEEIPEIEPDTKVLRICERFPKVAQQLQDRHNNRSTISVSDEHDVQDLLHALLRVEFDDVRAEEYSPSHGGSASRIDFLLKEEQLGIEVKYANSSNAEKELKNQLSEDKEHYKAHPDCEKLICFVYDPEFALENPSGFEKDLSSPSGTLETTVVVSPK